MNEKIMMRVAVVSIVACAGCVGGGGSPPTTPPAATPEPVTPTTPAASVEDGKKLYTSRGCLGCHGANGEGVSGLGTTLIGIAGSQRDLEDGHIVTADDAYLFESIKKPDAEIVKGYQKGLMIGAVEGLDDEDINALVAYIKTLK